MESGTQIESTLESIVATAAKILEEKGDKRLSDLLYRSEADVGVVEHDNWNGGTDYVAINLYTPIELYSQLSEKDRKAGESIISSLMSEITRDIENEHIRDLKVLPLPVKHSVVEDLVLRKLAKGALVKTVFDTYEIDNIIGQGGNGRVFAAKDSGGNECAIKFLDKDASVNKYKRFKNEIHFCETTHHKNIVSIIDRGLVSVRGREYAFYVMPRYDKTLRDKIKEGLSSDQAVEVFIGILEGLKEAHKHKAIHRDIKPENILFEKGSNVPVICDFGIAHIAPEDLATAVVTKPGDKMANAIYKAPEQNPGMGGAVPQSDVYAAGLILNEMFTGKIPAGEGYVTIGDRAPSYAYLDQIVSALYRQNPDERLYPIDKILLEISVRAEIDRGQVAKEKLRSIRSYAEPSPIKIPQLVSKTYKDGKLLFGFDVPISDDWLRILNQGSFSHNSLMDYDTNTVFRINATTLALSISRIDDVDNVSTVVEYFKDWVVVVNQRYYEHVVAEIRRQQQEEEDRRKQEIMRLEREGKIQAELLRL